MRFRLRYLFEALAVGAAAVVVAQEPLFGPTPRPAPQTTASPAPTATPGLTATPSAGGGSARTPSFDAESRLPVRTPRPSTKPLPYRQTTPPAGLPLEQNPER